MNRFLIGFLLSLGMLLLQGYNQLYLQTYRHDCTCAVPVQENRGSKLRDSNCINHEDQSFIASFASSRSPKERHKRDVTEIEEQKEDDDNKRESYSCKKNSGHNNDQAAAFRASAEADFFRSTGKNVGFCQRFSYINTIPSWHILFQVFRI